MSSSSDRRTARGQKWLLATLLALACCLLTASSAVPAGATSAGTSATVAKKKKRSVNCKKNQKKIDGRCHTKVKPTKLVLSFVKIRDHKVKFVGWAEFAATKDRYRVLDGYVKLFNVAGFQKIPFYWSVGRGSNFMNFVGDKSVMATYETTATLVIGGVASAPVPIEYLPPSN